MPRSHRIARPTDSTPRRTRLAAALALALSASLLGGTSGAAPVTAGAARPAASMFVIPFASGAVDPARDLAATDPAGHDLVLVQFERFGATDLVHRVAATGAGMVQPLAPVSYLVWADAAEARAIRRIDGVRFAGVLPASARVASSVTGATTRLRVTVVGGLDHSRLPGLNVWPRAFTSLDGGVVELDGGLADARALSRMPRVYSVADAGGAPQLRDERSNQIITQGTKSGALQTGYRDFLKRVGADGTGVIVSHVDGGVDGTHPELSGRIHACIDYTSAKLGCTAGNSDDVIGHGTHTLGIVLGTGFTGLGDVAGFDYGLGVAPGAKAVVQNAIGVGASAFGQGYRAVYRAAHDKGAIVSANSWGPSGTPKGYDANTREFDSMVRDINDTAPGDQPMALVFSVMNGSGGTSTQGTPDEGKNLIGVGGSGDRGTPGPDDLCTCSAHGPALDGRLLPTIVAPGQNVMSTKAAQGTLCGLPGTSQDTLPPSPIHASCTGTSMASPHVSGGYAVFVDWYRKHNGGATPSPALVKAAFVNGADDLFGGKDANGRPLKHIPNNQQGWGRFSIGNTMNTWNGGNVVHLDQSVVFDASGQTHSVRVEPVDPSKPLKVTLAWTDALGHGTGGRLAAWVNDLDLVVSGPDGTTWLGNDFLDGFSKTGGKADRRNNLENVYLKTPAAGAYSVNVNAMNLIGDGMPNREGLTDQDFALVVTNARIAPAA